MSAYQWGHPSNDEYAIELLRRARMHTDQNARIEVQQYLGSVVRGWLYRHPNRDALYQLGNTENYVNATFERFWQVTIDQQLDFNDLTTVMQYLFVSLSGAILDKFRTSSRLREAPLPPSTFPCETLPEDVISSNVVWERLQRDLLNVREQRLVYLLFHCGLKPQEIVHFCPQEFSDACEIYSLRHTIMKRLLHIGNHL
jgi:hypothetical protein